MGNGPLIVVGPDETQLDHLVAETRRLLPEWTAGRYAGVGELPARHVCFLPLPAPDPFPRHLRCDPARASILSLGRRDDLPAEVETFTLDPGDAMTVPPLLRALARRADADSRRSDRAAFAISRALAADFADLGGVLAALGPALGATRTTLLELRRDGITLETAQEWCAPPAESLKGRRPAVDRHTSLWLLPQLEQPVPVRIDDIAALPFTAIEARVLANTRNTQAVLIAALRSPRGEVRGALMAERTEPGHPWSADAERLLLMAAEMLANYLERRSARAEAQAGETVQRQVLEHIQDGVFMAAANGGGFSFVSPPAARMWGMTVEELLAGADNWKQVVHPEDLPRVRARVRSGLGEEALEFRILRADDGCERWIRLRSFPVRNVDGGADRLAGLLEDITEQRKQQARVRLLARVFETTGEAVVITDPDSSIIDVNPAFSRITGYARAEVLGKNPRVMSSGRHGREFYAEMWQALLTRHHWHGEIWDRRKDGTEYPKLLTINAITEPDGSVSSYVGVFADITEVKETEARLERMAHHDALTGLPNRVLFLDRLEQAVAQSQRASRLMGVMFLDLDGFKEINDRLGHRAGDQLLIEVAQRLRDHVRESDTVARLGGDEFIAILPQVSDYDGAVAVADKLLSALARPFDIVGRGVRISASIGISLFPDHAGDVDGLVRSADGAMYQAKEAGGNRHCFAPAFETRLRGGDSGPPLGWSE